MDYKKGLPNVFLTIAPAEWKTLLHDGVFAQVEQITDLNQHQATLTLHLYNAITTIFQQIVFKDNAPWGFRRVFEFVLRIEFQSRGTLHVHVLAWVEFDVDASATGYAPSLTGRSSGPAIRPEDPRLLQFLERLFNASVDVQCNNGHHNFLNYVTGYEMKSSDALQF